jgi:hypothetical protein
MRYFLLLFMALFLCGCQMKTEAFIRQEKMAQPENQPREKVSRYYGFVDTQEIMTISEPADYLVAKEIEWRYNAVKPIITDTEYWLPSKEFVTEKLLPAFRKHMKDNKIKYTRKFDCDDFSALFHSFSQKFYSDMVINKMPQAISVAEIYYVKTTTFITDFPVLGILKLPTAIPITVEDKHAINAIILDDLSVIFIEPQSGEECSMTVKEGKTIYYCKF